MNLDMFWMQTFRVEGIDVGHLTAPLADALWAILATLPKLSGIVLDFQETKREDDWLTVFLRSITLMTGMR